ncbi:MAG: Rrf2 family transcriptional regulator [Firmicutes bacterium]|nr:Rrf2 family transcriptional regulator [Bacillota bacterium]
MFTTKGRYALRVMIDLAEHQGAGNIPLKDIAERQEISKKYLEIICKELVKGGLIKSVNGKGGGYSLSRDIDEYTVGEILELMEGTLSPVACLVNKAEPCPRADVCRTLPMWKEYHEMVRNFFYGKQLSDLLDEREPVYYI